MNDDCPECDDTITVHGGVGSSEQFVGKLGFRKLA